MNETNDTWAIVGRFMVGLVVVACIIAGVTFSYNHVFAAGAASRQHEINNVEGELTNLKKETRVLLQARKADIELLVQAILATDGGAAMGAKRACISKSGVTPIHVGGGRCMGLEIVRDTADFRLAVESAGLE